MTIRDPIRRTAQAAALGVLLLACGETDLTTPGLTPEFRRGGNPGGKGGTDPVAQFEMTQVGAVAMGPDSATILGESQRQFSVESNALAAVAFTNTLGTDALLAANCEFDAGGSAIPAETRSQLLAQLRNSSYERNVLVRVNKRDGVGSIYLAPLDGDTTPGHDLIQFGGNAGDPAPDVTVVSGDLYGSAGGWTEPLVLRYSGGWVRSLLWFEMESGPNQLATLTCANQDEVTVTVERVGP